LREVVIDVSACSSTQDFYSLPLAGLGAPAWHGKNLDALWDTISSDDINDVRAAFTVHFINVQNAQLELKSLVEKIGEIIDEARAESVDVGCLIEWLHPSLEAMGAGDRLSG
jgi:RNAse (barnase) inhibitor barstar